MSFNISSINVADITQKSSATAPIVIPCFGVDTESGSKDLVKKDIMYKTEDLRKDYLIMNLVKIVNTILRKECGAMQCQLLTYNIHPTSSNRGMLELVPNAATLYTIEKEYKQDIWYYFRDKDQEGSSRHWKDTYRTFVKSAAVYSVVSYLMNVGDRHMENIMVTDKGELFHIDYGFILGEEPVIHKCVGRHPVRITQTMKKAIESGSKNPEEDFKQFSNLCAEIYLVLRRHYCLFMNILLLLNDARPKISFQFNNEQVESELTKRFMPGTADKEARDAFMKMLVQSSGDAIHDVVHAWGRWWKGGDPSTELTSFTKKVN